MISRTRQCQISGLIGCDAVLASAAAPLGVAAWPFSPHIAVDATYYERSPASKHYCDRTNYCVQTVEATKLVDTETQAILDVHCTTTREGSDADVCEQFARRYAGEL